MAYREGTITNADPAGAYITQLEGALTDQGGEAWAAATAYGGAGQVKYVRGNVSGTIYIFEATTAGTSHATTEPTWSSAGSVGNTLTDGTVTWTNRGLQTWVFVEQVVISTRTYRVWKNRGSGCAHPNAHATDFYIAISRVTAAGATEVNVQAFEVWDATNDKAIRPVTGNTPSQAINANYSFGDETNGFLLSSASVPYVGIGNMVTTGFEYAIQVSKDQICLAMKVSTSDFALYVGLFESLLPVAHPFPLCIIKGASSTTFNQLSSSGGGAGVSRHYGVTTTQASNFFHSLAQFTTPQGDATSGKDLMHNAAVPTRVLLTPSGGVAAYGYYHGLLYNMVFLAQGSTTWRTRDTLAFTPGPEDWVKMYLAGASTYWADKSTL